MNHYEILFIYNSEEASKGKELFEKCLNKVKEEKGTVHRSEDIGSRKLAYEINECKRGNYYLLNIECEPSSIDSISELFKFNEDILRSSILKRKKEETSESVLLKQTKASGTQLEHAEEFSASSDPKKSVTEKVVETTKAVAEKATEEAKEIVEKTEEIAEEVVESTKEVVEEAKEIVEKAEEVIEEVVESAKEAVEEVVESTKDIVEEAAEEVKEKTKGVFAKVKDAFTSDKK
tara:strand:+ start:719 stop:1420 length:702 start_codon:yes stop_codon:yes gene_type:complete